MQSESVKTRVPRSAGGATVAADVIQVILAVVFAAWFGRAASRADRNVPLWALGGAGLVVGIGTLVVNGGVLILMEIFGSVSPGAAFAALIGLWVISLVISLVVGSAILPEPARADLQVQLAVQEAMAESDEPTEGSLSCTKCDRVITSRQALIEGAIRIDDETCVCADCKQ
jgi:hypothetical protein